MLILLRFYPIFSGSVKYIYPLTCLKFHFEYPPADFIIFLRPKFTVYQS